ncbi:MAG: carbohydrate kinase [Prevotella sp.]|nr:carbohydrate kinase [Prevotella sp.]
MRKVIGIGETILDIIFKGNKVVAAVPGGSTFNAVISLGRCKTNASLLSETGDDRAGKYILDFMTANGVNTDYMLRVAGMKTPVSLAFLDERNDAEYTFYRSADSDLPDLIFPEVKADDIVLFGSYYAVDESNRSRVREFLDYAKNSGAILYYDVNYRPAHKDELVKLKPNIIDNLEFADIVRGSRDDFDIIYKAADPDALYRSELSFYTDTFIYTDGSRPVSVFGKDFRKDYPTVKGDIISTIGAGDSFNAGFIYALLSEGITRTGLDKGLKEGQWNNIIGTAQRFAADCCSSIFNYVSEQFAIQL